MIITLPVDFLDTTIHTAENSYLCYDETCPCHTTKEEEGTTMPTTTYDRDALVTTLHGYHLGTHIVEVMSDETITITDTGINEEASEFTAEEAVRLDREEAYKLYSVLHALFA